MSRTAPRPPGRARRRLLTIGGTVTAMTAALVLTAVPAFACPSLTITASPTTVVAGSDTTLTITATSNGNYTGGYIEVASTGGPGTLTSFTALGAAGCGGGVTSCAADGSYYKLELPALTNGETFTYTVDLTVDLATAATTFTPTAEFFEANGTNIGAQSGPVITVTPAHSDLVITKTGYSTSGTELDLNWAYHNLGPLATTAITYSSAATPAGFATQVGSTCGTSAGQAFSCVVNASLPAGSSGPGNIDYDIAALALGTYSITITLAPANNITPAEDSVTYSCTVVTALIVTCT
jgi:hypothetical protein